MGCEELPAITCLSRRGPLRRAPVWAQPRAFGRVLHGGGVVFGGPPRLAEVAERGVVCREVGEA